MLDQPFHSSVEILDPEPSNVPGVDIPLHVCPSCETLNREINVLRSEVGYWKSLHQRAVEREAVLKRTNEELEAKLKLRERQLFERRSEKGSNGSEKVENGTPPEPNSGTGKTRPTMGKQFADKRHLALPTA